MIKETESSQATMLLRGSFVNCTGVSIYQACYVLESLDPNLKYHLRLPRPQNPPLV